MSWAAGAVASVAGLLVLLAGAWVLHEAAKR